MRCLSRPLVLAAALAACTAPPAAVAPRPMGTAAFRLEVPRRDQRVEAAHGVVAAAHPLAAAAGVEMLRRGGNAVDAAVASAFVLAVVEQQMAGLGAGGALTLWRAGPKRAEYLDFYASAGADSAWASVPPSAQRTPEQMVAVPGMVDGLLGALAQYGTLERDVVLAPAIRAARDGFPVHSLLARAIAANRAKLTRDPAAARIFYPGGQPLQAGDTLVQPALAATLERIAREGRSGFYAGPVADSIVGVLRAGGSPITLADLRDFRTRPRRPLCTTYEGYTLLSAPPPLDGLEVFQTLALLDGRDLPRLGLPAESPAALTVLTDAVRLARADRVAYLGFPDDAAVPAVGIASAAYARERGALVGRPVADSAPVGDPWDEEAAADAPARCAALAPYAPTTLPRPATGARSPEEDGASELAQTTHLSVVDAERNAVSLTFTAGVAFGSGSYAAGTFLNSAANNFGGPLANRRAAGRTPRSTIAPTIVLDGDQVRLVVGSPGSGYIPPAIVHTILYTLVYGLDPWTAVNMPRVYPDNDSPAVEVEQGFTGAALAGLRRHGYDVVINPPIDQGFGGVHVVLVRPDGTLVGAADPRRDGAAAGY